MNKIPRDVIILAIGQALTSTVSSLLVSVASLSGVYLTPIPSLSTLPVTATVLGSLIMIYPAAMMMGKMGRRSGFMFKATVGVFGGMVSCLGLALHSFTILILGSFLLGIFNAFGQYYRFAAIDAAQTPEERTTTVAIVTGAGVVGGVVGPFLGGHFANALSRIPFSGSFIALSVVCALLALSQSWLSADLGRNSRTASAQSGTFDPHPDFIKVTALCAIGFAVMTLVMNAAPISMHQHGLSVVASSQTLQVHFALMYLPSLFNPILVRWFGLRGLVVAGAIAGILGCLLTLWPNQTYGIYMLELALSGVAWNFIFNGGTLLLATTYPEACKTKAQGINSLAVYTANIAASLSAGFFMATYGWITVNIVALPLLLIALLIVWQLSRPPMLAGGNIR